MQRANCDDVQREGDGGLGRGRDNNVKCPPGQKDKEACAAALLATDSENKIALQCANLGLIYTTALE